MILINQLYLYQYYAILIGKIALCAQVLVPDKREQVSTNL